MPTVVAVRFRDAGKLYHFDPGELGLHRLDKVVVETSSGLGIGRVVTEAVDKSEEELAQPVRRVLRKANAEDLERERRAKEHAEIVLEACRELARTMGIPLRPVSAESSMDRTRLTITYTSEKRIDYRQLVRGLASQFRCRVEMRALGARDEAKALGGYGPCGQQLCCTRWMTEFQPVSIKMAKLQHLALNPGKLAGVCGRLKCCLRYEIENYDGAERELPVLGSTVYTAQGEGRVVGLNLLERKVQILMDDPTPVWFPSDEVFSHNGCQGGGGCGTGGCACGTKGGQDAAAGQDGRAAEGAQGDRERGKARPHPRQA
jgi:cell fate regulator YaaT (PSP1 superfamily)